jgi:multicomponent Na+:H+ antiporter subunit D
MSTLEFLLVNAPALIVATPLLGAFLTPFFGKIHARLRSGFVLLVVLLTFFFVGLLAYDIFFTGSIHTYIFGAKDLTLPVVRILFEVDAMSMFMALISIILALVAVIYSWAYMKDNTGLDKFYTLVLLMLAGMLGMELTGDMFNFFVFLEITSIASCALIAFWTNKGKSVEAGFKYIVISTIGALFVLFAVALLYGQYDALNIAVLADAIQFTFIDRIALVLLVVALAMKAGIVPMHMWLPDAYGRSPAPVTIILVGATQASLYAVFRVCFTLYGNVITLSQVSVGWIMIILGLITILVGVIMALLQSGSGLAVLGAPEMAAVGMTAMKGGIFHIMNDALDVGLLFLVAGAVYYTTRETSIDRLGGLARNMKYTTVFFIIGLLAISGIPPMNGFASKLLIYESTYQLNPILAVIAVLSSIMLLAIFVKIFHSVFLGPALPQFQKVRESPRSMLLAMGIITAIILFFGFFPNFVLTTIVEPATNALLGYQNYIAHVLTGGL